MRASGMRKRWKVEPSKPDETLMSVLERLTMKGWTVLTIMPDGRVVAFKWELVGRKGEG